MPFDSIECAENFWRHFWHPAVPIQRHLLALDSSPVSLTFLLFAAFQRAATHLTKETAHPSTADLRIPSTGAPFMSQAIRVAESSDFVVIDL